MRAATPSAVGRERGSIEPHRAKFERHKQGSGCGYGLRRRPRRGKPCAGNRCQGAARVAGHLV